jgi:HD-like signal output (HDOD) protein
VALRILELTRDPDASLEELQRTLASDPALAGRVLHYANSVQLCSSRTARTVSEAVVRLGMRTVRQIALGFSVLAQARSGPCEGFDYNGFWSRSLAVAVGGQALAPHCEGATAEEAFTCGLLSGVGTLALASVHPRTYSTILSRWNGHDQAQLATLEQEVLLVSHDEVTAALFEC